MSILGTVFDIKEFTVHDGPGPRITVFLKGCPLRCRWCHNPEGLLSQPQLMYRKNLCTLCGACQQKCTHPECADFGRCLHVCPNGCLTVSGETVDADTLAQKLLQSAQMLGQMGGGITVSGGEPLLQPDFVCELAQKLGGVHKAIQTSGYAPPEVYKRVVEKFDYVLQDIKLADPLEHRKYTGVTNKRILENIRWLKQCGKPFVFRVPLIPGITNTAENLLAISQITEDFPVELMPYNALAGAKYPMVDMTYQLESVTQSTGDFSKYFKNATLL